MLDISGPEAPGNGVWEDVMGISMTTARFTERLGGLSEGLRAILGRKHR